MTLYSTRSIRDYWQAGIYSAPHQANKRRITIHAASLDEQSFDVPQNTYEGCLLVFPRPELIAGVKKELGWDDDVYAVECFLVKDKDNNLVVLADLNTAMPSEQPIGPFTVPQVLDEDEDTADEDDND